jgi:hypothetical protein
MGRWSLILLGLVLAAYVLVKDLQRRRFFRKLRMARITVGELQTLMQAGAQPTIIDVRSPGARARDGRRIPGALLVDMAKLEKEGRGRVFGRPSAACPDGSKGRIRSMYR